MRHTQGGFGQSKLTIDFRLLFRTSLPPPSSPFASLYFKFLLSRGNWRRSLYIPLHFCYFCFCLKIFSKCAHTHKWNIRRRRPSEKKKKKNEPVGDNGPPFLFFFSFSLCRVFLPEGGDTLWIFLLFHSIKWVASAWENNNKKEEWKKEIKTKEKVWKRERQKENGGYNKRGENKRATKTSVKGTTERNTYNRAMRRFKEKTKNTPKMLKRLFLFFLLLLRRRLD